MALFWSSRLNTLVLLPFPMLNNFGTRLLPRQCLHPRLDPRLLQPASPRKPVEAQALERQGWVQGMPLIIIRCLLATYLIISRMMKCEMCLQVSNQRVLTSKLPIACNACFIGWASALYFLYLAAVWIWKKKLGWEENAKQLVAH